MTQPPIDPERIAETTARRLLERATALDTDGPTLAQLREAAAEAGISHAAFDAAVAEWRAERLPGAPSGLSRRWADRFVRNSAGLASGWVATAGLAVAQGFVGAPWLVHKLTDPVGLAIGAVIAARLRARTATIILGGLAISQGAEFLMDLFSGAPAIQGFGAHVALMIAGVAGVAAGRWVWGRRGGPKVGAPKPNDGGVADSSPDDPSESRSAGLTNAEADKRFMESLRLRRNVLRVVAMGAVLAIVGRVAFSRRPIESVRATRQHS